MWNKLPSTVQRVLPPDDHYSYVVHSYQEIDEPTHDSAHFMTTVRINLTGEEDAKQFMERMSQHSTCTYRTTKTVKTCKKRVKCKFVKHCQHFAKKLSPKQAEKAALAKAKKAKAPLTTQLRNKKTNCPSSFTLVVQIPTKSQLVKAESQPHLLSHCGVLKINFSHNHPVKAAHTLSFRDVSTDTKKEMTDLFEMGHSASSARHAHEQKLLYETEESKQVTLADRAKNPNPQDVCRLYNKWRLGSYGDDNGKGLFEKLQEAVDNYNECGGGKAVLLWYNSAEQEEKTSGSEDEDMKPISQKKRKKEQKEQRLTPMILALCTNATSTPACSAIS